MLLQYTHLLLLKKTGGLAAGGPLQAPELHRLATLLRRPSSVTGNRFFVETSSDLQQAAPTDASGKSSVEL